MLDFVKPAKHRVARTHSQIMNHNLESGLSICITSLRWQSSYAFSLFLASFVLFKLSLAHRSYNIYAWVSCIFWMLHLQEQLWCAKKVFQMIFRKKEQVAPGLKRIWSPVWMILHWPWSGVNGLAAWRYYMLCACICQCWTAVLTWRQHRELKGKCFGWAGPGNQGLVVKECHWPQIDLATRKL